MSKRYVLFNFMTGDIINQNLPPNKGNDSVERNIIDGGLINVEVAWHELSAQARNDWSAYFLRLGRGVALVDDAEPITSKGAIPGAGFINKVTAPTGKGFLTVQGASVNEYLAARLAMLVWEEWTEPDLVSTTGETAADPVISGASWDGLLRHWAWLCFKQPTVAGAPRPPSIIRNGLAETTPGTREMPNEYDGTTVLGAMEAIRNDLSGVGVEWQFVPYFTDETRTRICFDLEVGTEANPHLNEVPMSIELSANSQYKITNHSTMHDSTEVFNKVLLRYQLPEETEGLPGKQKIFPKWGASNEIPLVEKYVNTSSVLTPAQLEALTAAYIEDGKTGGSEVSFTIAGEWNKTEWINNLGKLVTFTGLPDTISAGHSLTVRCVGLKMNAETSVVEATFAQLATVYPQTPQKKKIKKAITAVEKQGWTKYGPKGKLVHPDRDVQKRLDELNFDVKNGGGGGGGIPEAPAYEPDPTDWGVDGEPTPEEQHGSEGHHPGSPPPNPDNSAATALTNTVVEFPEFEGVSPVSVRSLCQTDTNRLYGPDHDLQGWGTRYGNTGTVTHYNGGMSAVTGEKLTPYRDILIKKTYLTNSGSIGPIETVGVFPAATIESIMPEYEWNTAYEGQNYDMCSGYHVSNWWVRNRYYIAILTYTYSQTLYSSAYSPLGGDTRYRPYYSNAKITVYSISVNRATGKFEGEWKLEPWTFNNGVLPHTQHIARYGDNVFFGAGVNCAPMKLKNMNATQFRTAHTKRAGTAYVMDFGENDPRTGYTMYDIYSVFAQATNLETGVQDWGSSANYGNLLWSSYNRKIEAKGLHVKNFADPASKLEWIFTHSNMDAYIEGRKDGGFAYAPVAGNGFLAVKGAEQGNYLFIDLTNGIPKGKVSSLAWSGDGTIVIHGAYGSYGAVANGALVFQGYSYNNSPPAIKTTIVDLDIKNTNFTITSYYDSGTYSQMHHKGTGSGGFPTDSYISYAISKATAVSGETGYQNGKYMSNFYSYNGMLYALKNGPAIRTGVAAIHVRAIKIQSV